MGVLEQDIKELRDLLESYKKDELGHMEVKTCLEIYRLMQRRVDRDIKEQAIEIKNSNYADLQSAMKKLIELRKESTPEQFIDKFDDIVGALERTEKP